MPGLLGLRAERFCGPGVDRGASFASPRAAPRNAGDVRGLRGRGQAPGAQRGTPGKRSIQFSPCQRLNASRYRCSGAVCSAVLPGAIRRASVSPAPDSCSSLDHHDSHISTEPPAGETPITTATTTIPATESVDPRLAIDLAPSDLPALEGGSPGRPRARTLPGAQPPNEALRTSRRVCGLGNSGPSRPSRCWKSRRALA